jgi:hypothetical protein
LHVLSREPNPDPEHGYSATETETATTTETETATTTETETTTTTETETATTTETDTETATDTATDTETATDTDNGADMDGSVDIDIIPCLSPNIVRTGTKGYVSVVIKGSETLDVRTIDTGSILFANAKPVKWYVHNISCNCSQIDFRKDLLLIFNRADLALDTNMTEITLTGETLSGEYFTGTDTVKVVNLNFSK